MSLLKLFMGMTRRKTRYLLLTVEDDLGAFPISWKLLPGEVIEKCDSCMVCEVKCYSPGEGRFKKDSVLYFVEIGKKEIDSLGESYTRVEDKKNKLVYFI